MREKLVIVGAGMMGCGIAARSALAGHETVLVLHRPEQHREAMDRTFSALEELRDYGLYTAGQCLRAQQHISTALDLADACRGAAWAIESINEDLCRKQEVFCRLDRLLPPEVPVLSNTSGLRITDIAQKMEHPERAFTAHFWLPAHLIPLVEVVLGDRSSPDLARNVVEELKRWGKTPVLVKKDLPGQLANRILQAVIREASHIVEIGLASAEDVDTAVKMGMALRFPVWGPLEHVDAVGLDVCQAVQNTVLTEISAARAASEIFGQHLSWGEKGYRTGKGFYDWSIKDMGRLEVLRNEFIVYALHFMQKHQLITVGGEDEGA